MPDGEAQYAELKKLANNREEWKEYGKIGLITKEEVRKFSVQYY